MGLGTRLSDANAPGVSFACCAKLRFHLALYCSRLGRGSEGDSWAKENLKEHLLILAEHEQKCEEPLVNEDELVMPALEACSDEDEKCAKE